MLLPSDVARLVLGYLQQEKLTATCKAFIEESPNLKEYAEHFSSDGLIPGCMLSLFGKSLTTILNEYVALKTKGKKDDIPLMLSSLWKKLDLTLSQIRSWQDSKSYRPNQRARTRYGIENFRRQRNLPPSASVPRTAVQQTSTPIVAAQVVIRPCNPHNAPHARPLFGEQSTIQVGPPPVTVTNGSSLQGASEKKSSSAVSSPMKRKTDSQKRRRAPVPSTSRAALGGETEEDSDPLQEFIDGNFPQLVIENAREKILSSKSLQEKLAENINKFLGSDSAPHNARPVDGGTVEQDTSIDEILGLQGGEIHMSEEAIHDILAQTETDPDFQELYDLFACTSKSTKVTQREFPNEETARSKATVEDHNLDVLESSFNTDDHSTSHSSIHSDGSSNQKNPDSLPRSPSSQKDLCTGSDDGESTTPAASDESVIQAEGKQSMDSSSATDKTGDDTVMETSKASEEIVSGPYCPHSSDVEMETISQTHVVTATSTPIGERDLSSNSGPSNHPGQESMSLESSTETHTVTTKAATDELHSTPNDTREMKCPRQQSKTVSPHPETLVSTVIPALRTAVAQKEDSRQDVNVKPLHLDESIADSTEKPVCAATAHEHKPPQNSAILSNTTHPRLAASGIQAPVPILQVPPSASGLPSKPASTIVSAALNRPGEIVPDPSQIITLNIITDDMTSDVELSNAVTAIVGEHFQSVLMSPVVLPQSCRVESSVEEADFSSSGDERHAAPQLSDSSSSVIGIQGEDASVYQVVSTSNPTGDSSLFQLMPAANSALGSSNSIFISSCGPQSTANQSNIMLIPNATSSGSQQNACVVQTSPRHGNMYAVGPTISSKLPQGSTIILASPVQPMLQGVMGMFPLSVVGGNTFPASSHQVMRVPVSSSGVPKLQLPPKPAATRILSSKGKLMPKQATDSSSRRPTSSAQGTNLIERNTSSKVQNKPAERPASQSTGKAAENHRRVLCFDTVRRPIKPSAPSTRNVRPQNKDQSDIVNDDAQIGVCIPSLQSVPKDTKRVEQGNSAVVTNALVDTAAQFSASASSKDQTGAERRTAVEPTAGSPCVVTADKENVQERDSETQRLKDLSKLNSVASEKHNQLGQEGGRKVIANILRKTPQKRTNLASTATKQDGDTSPDSQSLSPNSKNSFEELPIPRTPAMKADEPMLDNSTESTRTPTCKRYSDDGGTPRLMQPPATPDFPKCSPASETGSESSVSRAAHTLMILSRASMTKTGSNTPLKDNTQLAKPLKGSSKKRKLDEPDDRHAHRAEQHHSPSSSLKKKKVKKHRRNRLDSFPSGMDVDKFLMSLHYDE